MTKSYQITEPQFALGDFVFTDQGRSKVMGREWHEWPNGGKPRSYWLYYCAPLTKNDKGIEVTNRAAARYSADSLQLIA